MWSNPSMLAACMGWCEALGTCSKSALYRENHQPFQLVGRNLYWRGQNYQGSFLQSSWLPCACALQNAKYGVGSTSRLSCVKKAGLCWFMSDRSADVWLGRFLLEAMGGNSPQRSAVTQGPALASCRRQDQVSYLQHVCSKRRIKNTE